MAPEDKQPIADDAILWRRIYPHWHCRKKLPPAVSLRPSTQNFKDMEMSVDVASLTTLEKTLAGHEEFGVVCWTAGQLRAMGFEVRPDPLPDNSAHALVAGEKPKRKMLELADAAEWVHLPKEMEDKARG